MPDLRDAFRALKSSPVVTIVAVLSVALGIGANAAIFSIIDSLMLRPLPVKEAERLAILGQGEDNTTVRAGRPGERCRSISRQLRGIASAS